MSEIEFDYIICGVGLVGCIVVECLLCDFDVSVCVFEVGGFDNSVIICILMLL